MQADRPSPAPGGDTSSSFCTAAPALKAVMLLATASLVTRNFNRKRKTWDQMRARWRRWAKLNPKPALPYRKIMKLKSWLDIKRRDDTWVCEFFNRVDPRDPKYQLPVEDLSKVVVLPGAWTETRRREELGLPPEPISLLAEANKAKAAASGRGATTTQTKEKKEEKRVPKGGAVDISDVDTDFMSMKGIVLSRKQLAQRAQRAQMAQKRRK